MEFFNAKFLTAGFHTYFRWATIRKWSKGEVIFKVVEAHASELDTYHSCGFRKVQWVRKQGLGVRPQNFLFIHEPDISYLGLFTTIAEYFFRNGYSWNMWNFTRFYFWTAPYRGWVGVDYVMFALRGCGGCSSNANVCKQEGRGFVSVRTFTHKFLNLVPSP